MRPVAVLLCRMAVNPHPGKKGFEAVAERAAQEAPQLGPEGPLYARLDHVNAPEEKRHRSSKVQQSDGKLQRRSPFRVVPSDYRSRPKILSMLLQVNIISITHICMAGG
jgi:phosphotransacetylase